MFVFHDINNTHGSQSLDKRKDIMHAGHAVFSPNKLVRPYVALPYKLRLQTRVHSATRPRTIIDNTHGIIAADHIAIKKKHTFKWCDVLRM